MKGFINIIKPSGVSSAYAVNAVKYKTRIPCGHMGTLDPIASGVLPVGIGKTSRLFPFLLSKTKTYVARFKFGYSTDTLDITGQKTDETRIIPTFETLKNATSEFVGEISQIPPKYSAKCIDGKRGYQLSRQGIDFELKPKVVSVKSFNILSQTDENEYEFEIVCGGGTYIRSLCRDIALSCGSLGVMSALKRTQSGIFTIENGVTLEEFNNSDNIEKFIIPSDKAVDFPKLILQSSRAKKVLDGVFEKDDFEDGIYRVYNVSEQDFWGVGEVKEGVLRIVSYVR